MARVRTACPLNCWDACAVLATVKDGRVVELRGDPDHPITRGYLCAKARYQLERMYSPDRVVYPLLRTAGGWQRIGWADARAMIAQRIRDAVAVHGSQAVYYGYDAGSMGYLHTLGERFCNALGGTSLPAGSLCWAAGVAAQEYDFGRILANDPLDIRHARTIVLWGRDPANTNMHLLPLLKEARDAGAKVVLIDPVRTNSARMADAVLQPRPRSDAALALAASGLIASRGAADGEFLRKYAFGYDAFRAVAGYWTLERAEQATGLPADRIEAFARLLLRKPVCFLVGYGVQRHMHGGKTVRAIDALGAVAGSVGVQGGGVNYANGYISSQVTDLRAGRLGKNGRRLCRVNLATELAECLPEVKVAIFARSNPLVQNPGVMALRHAVRKIPFKVCVEIVMTDTARECDLVLPAATFLEQENLHWCAWHNHITFAAKAVEPLGEAKPDWLIFQELARELRLDSFPEKTAVEWMDSAISSQVDTGLLPRAGELLGQSVRFPGAPEVAWGDRRFATETGKFEFYSGGAAREDPESKGLPGYGGAVESSGNLPIDLVFRRHAGTLHSQFYEKLRPSGPIEVHVSTPDAQERLLWEGQAVEVYNDKGAIKAILRIDSSLLVGSAYVFEGGSVDKGQGVNVLTPPGPTDIGLGSRYGDCKIDIRAVESGIRAKAAADSIQA